MPWIYHVTNPRVHLEIEPPMRLLPMQFIIQKRGSRTEHQRPFIPEHMRIIEPEKGFSAPQVLP